MSNKVEGTHLGGGVPEGVVIGTEGDLAAVDVGDGYPRKNCSRSGTEHLVPVSQNDQNIRLQFIKSIGETNDAQTEGFGHRNG
ncbi:hypothetical protein SDC9_78702 [bioreactor metagenome]|uniref:Uncharacterized protein n=1 Tax=bioreactor metagenome TaxID=1076179 RepID=A0A644Z076_9ZZZZ